LTGGKVLLNFFKLKPGFEPVTKNRGPKIFVDRQAGFGRRV
jgi:hypothetical protein